MASWSWFAYDLASGQAIGALALASWSHEDRLNDAGSFTATLLSRGVVADRATIAATLPARSEIVPVRNGLPIGYSGINWRPDPPELAGAGLFSYFDAQTLDTTKTYTSVDQHLMMKDLVDWVQANGGNIRVDTTQVTTSLVLRDQTWNIWEQKNIGEAFRQKADNIAGFDFDVRIELDASGNPARTLRLWTPRRGRPINDASPVFALNGKRGNVYNVPSAPRDGTKMVTHVIAQGWETVAATHERLRAISTRTDLLAAGWPRLSIALDLPDVKDLTTLQRHADGYAYYNGAGATDEIVLDVNPDHTSAPWGSWDLGDDCTVVIPTDVSPWWPDGLTETRRIVATRWTVDGGGEHLQVVTGRPLGA